MNTVSVWLFRGLSQSSNRDEKQALSSSYNTSPYNNQNSKHKGRPIKITPDFSIKTMKARKSQNDVIQTLRDHECKPRLLYPAKLLITIDGENKIFHDKNRFKQYLSTNPALQKVLEGKLQYKEANCTHKNMIMDNLTPVKPKEGTHK